MNWNIGFKRITLVLSIACAILVASLFFQDGVRVLRHNKAILVRERVNKFNERVDGWSLKDEWKHAETLDEQNFLWIRWTGRGLGRVKAARAELERRGVSLESGAEERQKKAEECERLKKEGWQTAQGKSLEFTPEEVWLIRHLRKISELEDVIRSNTITLWVGPAVGVVFGFGGAWAVYALLIFVMTPLFKWIVLGFHEDKQKNEQMK